MLGGISRRQGSLHELVLFADKDRRRHHLKTASSLRSYTSKDLAQIAKKKGVPGWHTMRKEQLVQAILKTHKRNSNTRKSTPTAKRKSKATTTAKPNPKVARKMQREHDRRENMKDLALQSALKRSQASVEEDRIILIVRDPFWLQAYWEITRNSVIRAKAALAENWHGAQPMLRLMKASDDDRNGAVEEVLREIPIHGGVKNWYIDVSDPPNQFRVQIGYKATNGKFHLIARSNRVKTPAASGEHDENWADIAEDYEKYYAQSGGYSNDTSSGELKNIFEEKLRRPMHNMDPHHISHSPASNFRRFDFEVDAHMIVYGATAPGSNVTLGGEPVKLEDDGTFAVCLGMPDRRQVLPIVASSRDGSEQRTTVLAIERNTKVMEPITQDDEAI